MTEFYQPWRGFFAVRVFSGCVLFREHLMLICSSAVHFTMFE